MLAVDCDSHFYIPRQLCTSSLNIAPLEVFLGLVRNQGGCWQPRSPGGNTLSFFRKSTVKELLLPLLLQLQVLFSLSFQYAQSALLPFRNGVCMGCGTVSSASSLPVLLWNHVCLNLSGAESSMPSTVCTNKCCGTSLRCFRIADKWSHYCSSISAALLSLQNGESICFLCMFPFLSFHCPS